MVADRSTAQFRISMKNISAIFFAISIAFVPGVGVADATRIAKYAPKGYIHPIDAIFVREKVGNSNTAYKWEGVYRADPNNPKIKAELKKVGKSDYYSMGDAAVSIYERQLATSGIKVISLGTGSCTYMIRDRRGKEWQVMVGGDSVVTIPRKSPEFTTSISTPGG
jgi:hypothetical protein